MNFAVSILLLTVTLVFLPPDAQREESFGVESQFPCWYCKTDTIVQKQCSKKHRSKNSKNNFQSSRKANRYVKDSSTIVPL